VTESRNRPEAFSSCYALVNFTQIIFENITVHQEVTEEEKERIMNACEETLTWMDKKEKDQSTLRSWDDHVVTSHEIMDKCEVLQNRVKRFIRRPMRKPKPQEVNETITNKTEDGKNETFAQTDTIVIEDADEEEKSSLEDNSDEQKEPNEKEKPNLEDDLDEEKEANDEQSNVGENGSKQNDRIAANTVYSSIGPSSKAEKEEL